MDAFEDSSLWTPLKARLPPETHGLEGKHTEATQPTASSPVSSRAFLPPGLRQPSSAIAHVPPTQEQFVTRLWNERVVLYPENCKKFCDARDSGLITAPKFDDISRIIPIPTVKWFLTIYCNEVMGRIDKLTASIRSTFGRVLKVDSTKKVTIVLIS
ncbi:uncharacterized protein LOC117104892 [Anneissia japonica]|uniref:uncharacterized protein LOC117104892 n=1 Tax=Anneissia japonica TaxID=1529436 RepID=UPI00142579FE|nr:uncharacterized protein LOC117104892 [Anneissia japonica]